MMIHFNNNRTTKPFRYNKTPSKVVSIPVHFVGSERNRNDSAMVIQRVARGYLMRKCMKKMLKMKVELEEIDKKVNNEETVKMMKKEQKERIRMGETIMNLLLKLDSVRVFHFSALRDLRKLLIKRAIFLQEFIDQIQTLGSADEVEDVEGKCEEDCLMKVKEEQGQDEVEKEEDKEESVGSSFEEGSEDVKEEEGRIVIGCEDEEEENREMLRRMMDENEMMMYMMTQLYEKNEKQASVLTSLTQRVEQLERAFTCDKLKKKNKRRICQT
ncbi:BAG family molecular chaperone regulator 5, mitochondrial-like [Vicia villosa]|uniref:BAG family molecular chaperone regulator 5, mitochondrial-like n=1 Tax=Vicia villosa TaxID=3911 RepID=UPI00273BEC11|nr:BAG family molecular chaperone regulator 5, mitochondrial-like [Vicia villosa]